MCQRTHAWLSEPSKRGSLDSQSSRHVVIVRHPQQSPAEPVSRGPLWTRGWIEATQNTNWGINKGTLWNGLALYRKWGSSRYCIHCAQKARKDRSTHQQLALLAHEPRDWEGICHISFFKKGTYLAFVIGIIITNTQCIQSGSGNLGSTIFLLQSMSITTLHAVPWKSRQKKKVWKKK